MFEHGEPDVGQPYPRRATASKEHKRREPGIRRFAAKMEIEGDRLRMYTTPLGFYDSVSDEYEVLVVGATKREVRAIMKALKKR